MDKTSKQRNLTYTEKELKETLERLEPRDLYAYNYFRKGNQPEIAEVTAVKLFELFLNGQSCEQIRELNNHWTLGQIVHARVKYKWDQQRDEHVASLMARAKDRITQVGLESVNYLSDMLAATHKLHGEKVKRFLQSGDEKELEGTPVLQGFRGYKDILAMLLTVTGQDVKRVKGEITHTMQGEPPKVGAPSSNADVLAALVKESRDVGRS